MHPSSCSAIIILLLAFVACDCWDEDRVFNIHFHTHFFQSNNESVNTATTLRERVNQLISNGFLKHCSTSCQFCGFNNGPVDVFTVGSFLTCCNKSSVTNAVEFFSKNRGPMSVFVHPVTITRSKTTLDEECGWDHHPLDLSKLPVVRDPPPTCN